MQDNLIAEYVEHHSTHYTFKPSLIDNDALNEGQHRLEEAQVENKHTELSFKIVQAAIVDSQDAYKSSDLPSELENIKNYYLTELEFEEEALPLYLKVTELYENLTERQAHILYKFVVERFRIIDIANYYKISAPGVKKTLQLIQRKAKKLKISELL